MRNIAVALAGAVVMAATFLYPSMAPAGWGSGGCGPVGSPRFSGFPVSMPIAAAPQAQGFYWFNDPAQPKYLFLRRQGDGGQVGAYVLATGLYVPYDGSAFGAACEPPIPVPTGTVKPSGFLTGVEYYGHGRENAPPIGYTIDGRKVSQAEALKEVREPRRPTGPDGGGVPDDRTLPYIFPTGDEAFNARVLKDLDDPRMTPLKGQFKVQDLRKAEAWPIKDRDGQVAYAADSVYFEPADGDMSKGYRIPAEAYRGVDSLLEGLRKVKPYDPNDDPNPLRPNGPDGDDDTVFGVLLFFVGIGVCGAGGYLTFQLWPA